MAEEAGDFLALLAAAERDALLACSRERRVAAGERLLHEDDPGDSVLYLQAGRVKATRTTEGREIVLGFRGPGDLVGELAVIDGRARSTSVTALEPVEALSITAGDFRRAMERHPRVALALLEMMSRRWRDADLKRIEFGASDTVGRVAARLVELAERWGEEDGGALIITLPLSQEELAGWAAASRAGVASALRTLRELGWIDTDRRRTTVRDLESLRRRSVQN
jgi:CRP/FNR family transcriptional regulator, cyclic AMP receptor protein